ncbi:unnamed protein product [Rangifer tarandus platyrhynchus]|uniref:Uncharacterized protein n=1 Tax=Rangifer tarandus platyrhynchus TaxID=3082113 RepID=A0AC59Z743_RANTA
MTARQRCRETGLVFLQIFASLPAGTRSPVSRISAGVFVECLVLLRGCQQCWTLLITVQADSESALSSQLPWKTLFPLRNVSAPLKEACAAVLPRGFPLSTRTTHDGDSRPRITWTPLPPEPRALELPVLPTFHQLQHFACGQGQPTTATETLPSPPLRKRSSCVQPAGSWGQTGGQPCRKGRGGLADTSVSERWRKRARNSQLRQEGVGGPPCRQPLPPWAVVSGGAEQEPAPGCQHKGFDKTGSDSPRAPQTFGSVPIYSSAPLVTQKQGRRSRAIQQEAWAAWLRGTHHPGEGPPRGHRGP